MVFAGLGKVPTGKYCCYPESPHHATYRCLRGVLTSFVYFPPDPAVAVIWMIQENLPDFSKQLEVFLLLCKTPLVVMLASGNPQ